MIHEYVMMILHIVLIIVHNFMMLLYNVMMILHNVMMIARVFFIRPPLIFIGIDIHNIDTWHKLQVSHLYEPSWEG